MGSSGSGRIGRARPAGEPAWDPAWRAILWGQFGAALAMLENAVRACPDDLWRDRSRRPEVWYLVYHTLFFLDLYLSGAVEGFAPPAPFTLDELDPAGVMPDRPYARAELLGYLEHGRDKCRSTIATLTGARARERCVFPWGETSFLELLLYNMRHVQHHTAQLNLVLRQATDAAPGWVARVGSGHAGDRAAAVGGTVYQTGRLRLEPLRAAHAAELFELLADERLYRYVPQDPPASPAALGECFRRLETRRSARGDEAWLNWVVRAQADGRCVGRVEVTILPDGRAQLAYQIGAAFWRQGIATEACARVIRALFEEGGVREGVAEVDTRNRASIRLLERLGFRRGALREGADVFKGSASDEWTFHLARPAGERGEAEGRG